MLRENTKREGIVKLKQDNPSLSVRDISKKVNCSRRYTRRILAKYKGPEVENTQDISEEEFYKLALMTGLKKKTIPLKYRRALAELVMNVEDSLEAIQERAKQLASSSNKP